MTDGVIPIFGGFQPGDPDPDLVDMLEGLLERARSGHVTGLAFAALESTGAVEAGWKSREPGYALAAAVGLLNAEYFASLVIDRKKG